jgi:hypothetical protein
MSHYVSGNEFQPGSLRDRGFPFMGLEVTNHNIFALPFELLGFLQHAVRLANARYITKEHFQLAPAALRAIVASLSTTVDR